MAVGTKLDQLLGASGNEPSESDFARIIALGVQEDSDIDFKQSLYGNSDSEKRALAGDVAAMANSIGGVLILGIGERDGAATELSPVSIAEEEAIRMRQILGGLVSPLPDVNIVSVPSSEPTRGYWIIEIPRSPLQPHAVRVGDSLRYPRRYGATTGYMTESEVADRYRNRFLLASDQTSRARRILAEAIQRLNRKDYAWLALALVPNLPGEIEI